MFSIKSLLILVLEYSMNVWIKLNFFLSASSVWQWSVHYLWDLQVFFLTKFSLKMNLTILFTHLKITLLLCFQFSIFRNKRYSNRLLGQHQSDVTKAGNLNLGSSSLHPIRTLYLWNNYHAKGARLFCMYFINLSIIKNMEE